MPDKVSKVMVALGAKGADARELDELTRSLGNELRQLEVQNVERPSNEEAPPGSKGDPLTLGLLIVTLMPIFANKLLDVLVDWSKRRNDRTVKITLGQNTLELSAANQKERQKLLDTWLEEVGREHSS